MLMFRGMRQVSLKGGLACPRDEEKPVGLRLRAFFVYARSADLLLCRRPSCRLERAPLHRRSIMSRKNLPPKKLADEIIDRLLDGRTLTSICKELSLKPSTVYKWTRVNTEFGERFTHARDFGDLILEDQAIDYADARNSDEELSEFSNEKGCGSSTKKFDNVARSRLMAETRLKIVARRKGAKITNTLKIMKKSEAEEAEALSNDDLLEIARMSVDDGEDA